jgi:hypothetical protein
MNACIEVTTAVNKWYQQFAVVFKVVDCVSMSSAIDARSTLAQAMLHLQVLQRGDTIQTG